MAIQSAVLTFQTGTGTTPVAVAHGLGATPKFALVLLSSQTLVDGTPVQNARCGIGFVNFADAAQQRTVALYAADGLVARNSIWYSNQAGTNRLGDTFQLAADATNVTLTPTDAFLSDYAVTVLVLGGADLTDVFVGSRTSPTATGAFALDVTSGTAFAPDLVFVAAMRPATSSSGVQQSNGDLSFGWGTASAQAVLGLTALSGASPADTQGVIKTDAILASPTAGTAGTYAQRAALTGFSSTGATLNMLAAPASEGPIIYALLKGVTVHATTAQRAASAGAVPVSTTVGTPRAVVAMIRPGVGASQTQPTDHNNFALGVSDGTTHRSLAYLDPDGISSDNASHMTATLLRGITRSAANTFANAAESWDAVSFGSSSLSITQTGGDSSTSLVPLLVLGEVVVVVADRINITSQPAAAYEVGDTVTIVAAAQNASSQTDTSVNTGTWKLRARTAPAGWDLTYVIDSDTPVSGQAALTFVVPMAGTWTFGVDDDADTLTDSAASTSTTVSAASGGTLIFGDDAMQDLLKGGATARRRIQFQAVDSSGAPVTGLTGTPTLSINGAAASATGSNAAREIGVGFYDVEVTDANITAGDSVRVIAFSTANRVVGGFARVVAVDVSATPPTTTEQADAVAAQASIAAGLTRISTNLDTTVSSRNATTPPTTGDIATAVAAHADVQAIKTAAEGVRTDVTTARAGNLDRLDANVSEAGGGLTTAQEAKVDSLVADMLEVLRQTVQTGAESSHTTGSTVRTVVTSDGTSLGTLTYTRNGSGRTTGITFTAA